jgi:GntR family transcriptional regulator
MALTSVSGEPRPLDRSSPLPLWAQLVAELRRRHEAGAFASRFPSDKELIETYGVSRQTVRDAVRHLSTTVALDRQRGRGTFLRTPEFEQPVGTFYSLFKAIEAQGVEQRSVVRAKDLRTDAAAASELGLAPEASLVYVERLRLAGGLPLALEQVWLPADLAEAVLESDFAHTALYDELRYRCGLRPTAGEERILPIVVDRAEARLLGLPAGSAAFLVERRTWVGDRILERRHTLVRGDRYAFVASWSADAPHPGSDKPAVVGSRGRNREQL